MGKKNKKQIEREGQLFNLITLVAGKFSLEEVLAKLAEAAGYGIHKYKHLVFWIDGSSVYPLPGASGTIEPAEVNTVLEWLAKAGYWFSGWSPEDRLEGEPEFMFRLMKLTESNEVVEADSLPLALTEAVRRLPL